MAIATAISAQSSPAARTQKSLGVGGMAGKMWFQAMDGHHIVLWWADAGHTLTLDEAAERLRFLHENGRSDFAFGWAESPDSREWDARRCA